MEPEDSLPQRAPLTPDEVELRRYAIQVDAELNRQAIEAQREDRANLWRDRNHARNRVTWIAGGVVASLLGFVVVAMLTENALLVEKLLYLLFGGVGGAGLNEWAHRRGSAPVRTPSEE